MSERKSREQVPDEEVWACVAAIHSSPFRFFVFYFFLFPPACCFFVFLLIPFLVCVSFDSAHHGTPKGPAPRPTIIFHAREAYSAEIDARNDREFRETREVCSRHTSTRFLSLSEYPASPVPHRRRAFRIT